MKKVIELGAGSDPERWYQPQGDEQVVRCDKEPFTGIGEVFDHKADEFPFEDESIDGAVMRFPDSAFDLIMRRGNHFLYEISRVLRSRAELRTVFLVTCYPSGQQEVARRTGKFFTRANEGQFLDTGLLLTGFQVDMNTQNDPWKLAIQRWPVIEALRGKRHISAETVIGVRLVYEKSLGSTPKIFA